MFYSKTTGGFYSREIHGDNMPADAVKITTELHAALIEGQSHGKRVTADENGYPILQDVPPTPVGVLLASVKDELRIMRRDMLDAVTGIGFRASVAGNTALAQEAATVSQQLLDITNDAALNAAQTYEEMRAAGVAAYRRIAAGASHAFAATFKEFTGA